MDFQLPGDDSQFAKSVRRRVDEEYLVWLTAMGKHGMPQPAPVWFWWDSVARNFLIYNQTQAKRLDLVRSNPQVALNFDGYGTGFGIVTFLGQAAITTEPPADRHPAYLAKYSHWMTVKFGSPAKFAAEYSVPLRVNPIKVRGSSA
jgi:PPOX class probable F420-dependent enzyme